MENDTTTIEEKSVDTVPSDDPLWARDVMPEPSEFADKIIADEIASEPAAEVSAESPQLIADDSDDETETFDPNIHASNPDGTPRMTKDGKRFAKKRGPKGPRISDIPTDENLIDPVRMDRARKDAGMATGFFFMVGTLVLEDEGQPIILPDQGVNEPAEIHDAFTRYFYARGPLDLPPEATLGMMLAAYIARRSAMPKTRSKLIAVWEWTKEKFGKLKLWGKSE